jgi:hypothetical protein
MKRPINEAFTKAEIDLEGWDDATKTPLAIITLGPKTARTVAKALLSLDQAEELDDNLIILARRLRGFGKLSPADISRLEAEWRDPANSTTGAAI